MGKGQPFNKMLEKLRSICKKVKLDPYFASYAKLTPNGLVRPIRPEMIKFLEEKFRY